MLTPLLVRAGLAAAAAERGAAARLLCARAAAKRARPNRRQHRRDAQSGYLKTITTLFHINLSWMRSASARFYDGLLRRPISLVVMMVVFL
jgi:hypothetical protein